MGSTYDAVVVGAGHNGLTAALTLAAQGRRVLVAERSDAIGGLCAARTFAPGYRTAGLLPDTSGFRQRLVEAFELESHGLELHAHPPSVLVPGPDGDLLLPCSHRSDPSELAGSVSQADRDAYAAWRGFLKRVAPFIERLLDAPPPRLAPASLGELRDAAATGWALRRLGRRDTVETLRVLPMCAADWLRERFESETLSAALAAPSLLGSFNGPWAAGSAANLIFREAIAGRSIVGGPPALVEALTRACESKDVEIRTSTPVEEIEIDSGRVRGVSLGGGESISCDLVLATCSPKTTLLELVRPLHLDATTERELLNFRSRGAQAVLLLAVEGPIAIAGQADRPISRLRLGAGSFDDLERTFDALKYRRVSETPYLEIWIPSLERPDLAPAGSHVISALVHCVPAEPAEGWTAARREALIQACVHLINDHIPGIRERLTGGRLLAPPDLEDAYTLPGGHLLHGEPALDQLLFLRPTLELARYRTPIEGLFIGGSGSHPGGGVTGMPGHLAARAADAAS